MNRVFSCTPCYQNGDVNLKFLLRKYIVSNVIAKTSIVM